MEPSSPSPAPDRRRFKKRVVIPVLIIVLFLALLGGAWVAGSWADTESRTPRSSAEGTLCQLYRAPDGHTLVRCARIFDHAPEAVWRVVTDYDHFSEIFPQVRAAQAEKEADDLYLLSGTVSTPIGPWEFRTHVRHKESPDHYVASWDEPGGQLTVARGSWDLTRLEGGRTLLVYTQEVELAGYPTPFVRAALRTQLPRTVEVIERRLQRGPTTP